MEAADKTDKELKHDEWAGTTYGNGFMHRWLIRMLRVIDVRILYLFAKIFVVPPTMVIGKKGRKSIIRFFREWKGYGKFKALYYTYLNHCRFSEVVIDRFAMYAGKKFDIEIEGYDHFLKLASGDEGFVQVSSHIGNYELAGYSLRVEKKIMNALVFGGEKESVMENRLKMFGGNNIRMIKMSPDMNHIFEINSALQRGEIISMPADRIFGSQKGFEIEFLGRCATFPQGPFVMAAVRRVPLLFVAVMKERGKRYRIIVKPIQAKEEGKSAARAEALCRKYVEQLEEVVSFYPTQWYNYFDFWNKPISE